MSKTAEKYRKWMEVQNMNPNTINSYVSVVRLLERHVGKDPAKCTRDDIIDFLSKYSELNTRSCYIYALKNFFGQYLGDLGPMKGMRGRHQQKELKWWYTPEEIRLLLKYARNQRNRAIYRVGYDLALRVGEVVRLNRSDVDSKSMTITVKVEKKSGFKIVRKDLYPQTLKEINKYLKERKDNLDALFVTETKRFGLRRITPASINWNFKRDVKRAGIRPPPPNMGYHMLRHSRAAHLRARGTPLDTIRKFLDHERISTTLIYASIGPETISKEISPPEV